MTETKMQLADCKSQLELALAKADCIVPISSNVPTTFWLRVGSIIDDLNLQGWMTYAYDSLLTCPKKSYSLFTEYVFKLRRPNGSTRTLFVL